MILPMAEAGPAHPASLALFLQVESVELLKGVRNGKMNPNEG